jgi:hypothetical protein
MANALNLGNIVLPGDGFPDFDSFSIPIWDGLVGAFLFKNGLSPTNMVPDSVSAAIVGAPVVGDGYVSFTGTAYLQTELSDSSAMTLIVGCRPKVGPVAYIGNYLSSTLGGQSISSGAAMNSVTATSARGASVNGQAILTGLTAGAWGCYAAKLPGSGQSEAHDLLKGTKVSSPGSGNRVLTTEKIRIGSSRTVGFESGTCDISFALIYNRAVSDAELASISGWARGYMKDSGLISS